VTFCAVADPVGRADELTVVVGEAAADADVLAGLDGVDELLPQAAAVTATATRLSTTGRGARRRPSEEGFNKPASWSAASKPLRRTVVVCDPAGLAWSRYE
jgi:hypothetical protein